jgi:hypothetical protein
VAQGTFAQQRQATTSQQEQGRITRTQRKEQEEQQKRAKYNFDLWSSEAERLRSEVFIDKPVQQKYYEEVPNSFVRNGEIDPRWYRMSDRERSYQLQNSGQWVTKFERTRTVTDPFTFEEYKQEYTKLDPTIKQFFATPESITAEQERKKQVERDALQKQINQANIRMQNAMAKIQKENDWFNSLEGERRRRNRDSYERSIREYEYDLEEYRDQINEAQSNADKIEQGATAGDIWNYAENKADYERSRHEDRDSARAKFNQSIKTGEISSSDLLKLGFKEGEKPDYNKFVGAIDKYNKDVAYKNQLISWGGKVGYDKLPDYAKQILNPSAMEWQKANPTEKLVFDKQGNVVGVESGKLQQSMNLDAYNKLASKTPDDYYKEWEIKQKDKPIYLDMKAVNVGFLPYKTRGTINANASPIKFVSGSQASQKPQSFGSFVSTMPVVSQVIGGYNWAKDRVHWDFGVSSNPITQMPQIDLFSFGLKEEKTNAEKWAETGQEKLTGYSQKLDEWVIGKEKIEGFKEQKEGKYQGIYQNAFERQYMKKLIYGEVDYETASKQFEQSAEAKRIGERYSEEFGEGYKQLQVTEFSLFSDQGRKSVAGGLGQVGLGIGSLGLNIIDNPVDLGLTVGAVYTGGSILKALPTSAQLGLTGGFLISGLKTTFDKTLTYSERSGGLVTSVITGASITRAGYKYLQSPVIKTVKIPKPKTDLYASEIIGKDLKMIANGKTFNKVLYGEQKLSQVSQAGRRTVVTTKWRDLLNRYADANFKPIYRGIPSQQRAIYGSDVFRGGNYKITQSGYEKAMKKLLDYGYTKGQATRTLRFYAPKTTEQWLKSGSIDIKSDISASGKFAYETRKAVFDVGDGIKTKGGRTIQEVYRVERKIIEINDQKLMLEMRSNVGKYLNKKGIGVKVKDVGFSTTINKAWASDTRQGVEFLRKAGGMDIYRDPASFKDIYSISKGGFSITATPKRTKTIIEIMDKRRSYNLGKTKLFEWELDLDRAMAGSGKRITIQKGNAGAFGSDKVSASVDKIVEKITGQKASSPIKFDTSPKGDLTQVISDQKVMQLTEKLKGGLDIAPIKQTKIGGITRIKEDEMLGLGMGMASVSAVKLKGDLKMNNAVVLKLNEIQQLKINQINSQLLKQQLKPETAQRTAPLLRFQTPQLQLQLLLPRLNIPTYKIPPAKPFPKIVLFGDEELKAKIKAKKGRRSAESFALLPDFTSRAIGLAPKEFGSVKDAMREIKMLQTGFGIRRGGRIKGFSPIDEKSLLKGIMK